VPWLNDAVAEAGSAGSVPVAGRIGKSPATAQPGPDTWVRLYPVMLESLSLYPPPSGRDGVSGLHWTMPNGRSAPGNVSTWPTTSPPLPVPTSGSTRPAGLVTAAGAAGVAAA
jgi:hypothetical protein